MLFISAILADNTSILLGDTSCKAETSSKRFFNSLLITSKFCLLLFNADFIKSDLHLLNVNCLLFFFFTEFLPFFGPLVLFFLGFLLFLLLLISITIFGEDDLRIVLLFLGVLALLVLDLRFFTLTTAIVLFDDFIYKYYK